MTGGERPPDGTTHWSLDENFADGVRDVVEWAADVRDPVVLTFVGWAFSARPLASGWQWNAATRRGTARVWISDGFPKEGGLEWVRENAGAIADDKGVALEAGAEVTAGATWRCVSERFGGGIIRVGCELAE